MPVRCRWGRFQDVDEAAHYEFICKQAGIKVSYCAEQFDNDESMLSNIVKNLKRVMAAEYSRELSQKVHAGSCRFARMGFQLGGRTMFGLQRVLVDEKLQQKKVLIKGDRKYLMTDHVRLRPGEINDRATIAWIFRRFTQLQSETAIARELNEKAVLSANGRGWNRAMVGRILRNENYLGNTVYNRRSRKLGGVSVYNPPEDWGARRSRPRTDCRSGSVPAGAKDHSGTSRRPVRGGNAAAASTITEEERVSQSLDH